MTANRMPKMPSLKASARSAAKPAATQASATKPVEKRSEKAKDCVNSFDQLKDLVGA